MSNCRRELENGQIFPVSGDPVCHEVLTAMMTYVDLAVVPRRRRRRQDFQSLESVE